MMTADKSKYWLDQAVAEIQQAQPEGEIIVSSGHSPSGNYHFGLLREFLIASAIASQLRAQGCAAKHIDFVDDFDVLRKVPVNVSAEWEQHLGKPLYLVPDPFGDCHESYGDHFLAGLYGPLEALGVEFESLRAHQYYLQGKMAESIEKSLTGLDEARTVITEVSQRQLPDDWSPVQILSDNNDLREWQFTGWDQIKQVVKYKAANGVTGEVSYVDGRVKLDWRLDWPARWALFKVGVEPFGRDHASKGGSYDTGKVLVDKIFGGQAPYPVPYDFVNLAGQTKKMSKSAGNILTPADILEIMPPEIVRYYFIKARPAKLLVFDPGIGLFNLIDEFSGVQEAIRKSEPTEYQEAFEFATANVDQKVISPVRFNHLVTVFQTAHRDAGQAIEILKSQPEYDFIDWKTETEIIRRELDLVASWLDKYAPDELKFEVQDQLPTIDLSDQQSQFLATLADKLEATKAPDAQTMHNLIYEAKGELSPAAAFQALYRVIIGGDKGPRAGWFLASLDQDWLIKRLRQQS